MAFCFHRRESVQKAIGRLGLERIENALECQKDCGRAEAVHCARKDIKKVRAVLRLVRTGIAKKKFGRLAKLLREAANQLAVLRDAYIRAKTLQELARHFKGQLAPGALRHVRTELRHDFDEEMKRFGKERTARAVERTLCLVAKEMARLDVDRKGWKALGPGVKRAYSEGRCAYQRVRKGASPENFHSWRKRVKDLWYQVTLLQPVWPEQMDAMARELEGLGKYLGHDHDLVVLRKAVAEQRTGEGKARELEALNGLIEERQRELRAAALALGARFYDEKPSTFCNRLAGYWRIWRREPKPAARTFEATHKCQRCE
jgi:CHAD domain-containing protein